MARIDLARPIGFRMKILLLLGDSIRLSYGAAVQEKLKADLAISGPDDNCRFAAYTLFNLVHWLEDRSYDIIQWNNGQWDTCHMLEGNTHPPLERYCELEVRIARILKTRTRRLISATTTPVKGDLFAAKNRAPRSNEDIEAYNAAVRQALEPEGVEFIDLYTPVKRRLDECICEDLVHLTPTGVEVCATEVAQALRGGPAARPISSPA